MKKSTEELLMPVHLHTAPAITHRFSYDDFCSLLWELSRSFPGLRHETIGSSAGGRSLYALSIGGEGDLPSVLYAGTDWLSAAVLLRFLTEYSTLLAEGGRIYRVHLPALFAGRRISVCPIISPDAMEPCLRRGGTGGLTNALGADIASFFTDTPDAPPEKCPEAMALRQYLLYGEASLFCLLTGGETDGLQIPAQPSSRAGTVGRLLARMLTSSVTSADSPVLSVPAWYAAETGHPAYGLTLGVTEEETCFHRAYAAVRELLYSAPLLL